MTNLAKLDNYDIVYNFVKIDTNCIILKFILRSSIKKKGEKDMKYIARDYSIFNNHHGLV